MKNGLFFAFVVSLGGKLLTLNFLVNRMYLESESEKDMPAVMQLRLHFALFLYKMITSAPGKSNS